MATIYTHNYDLPDDVVFPNDSIAIDTETMGLRPQRDRLCVVQISGGDGTAHVVHFPTPDFKEAKNLSRVLNDHKIVKIFHYARFDVAVLYTSFKILCQPVYCTKIASKMVRTYTDRHGLKELCREFLNMDLSKQEQSSYWGAAQLTQAQQHYAAGDVLYLHQLREQLDKMLVREGRQDLAKACFDFLPHLCKLDLEMMQEMNIFEH